MEIRDDVKFALKLMADFKKSQPKKKRRNIDVATRKLRNGEPLNKRDRERLMICENLSEVATDEEIQRRRPTHRT